MGSFSASPRFVTSVIWPGVILACSSLPPAGSLDVADCVELLPSVMSVWSSRFIVLASSSILCTSSSSLMLDCWRYLCLWAVICPSMPFSRSSLLYNSLSLLVSFRMFFSSMFPSVAAWISSLMNACPVSFIPLVISSCSISSSARISSRPDSSFSIAGCMASTILLSASTFSSRSSFSFSSFLLELLIAICCCACLEVCCIWMLTLLFCVS